MLFANRLYELELKRSSAKNAKVLSALAPDKPIMEKIPDIWLTHNSFKDLYNKTLNKYYVKNYSRENENLVKKYYPEYDSKKIDTLLYSIGPKGKPQTTPITYYQCRYTYKGADVSYTELNEIKDRIKAERTKLFKNKRNIEALTKEHKRLRGELSSPCEELVRTACDKVFLCSFANEYFSISHSVDRNLFLCNVGWIKLPPYFFSDSLYDLKNKAYEKYDVSCYINLLPAASLAIITEELAASEGDAFFKAGVTVDDVILKVKEQAENERRFIQKFDLKFAASLLYKRISASTPDTKNTNRELTLTLPYMGLDRLDDGQLSEVGREIFDYYSLFEKYPKYANWFRTYPLEKYYREVGRHVYTMDDFYMDASRILPYGERDIPYFDHYLNALSTNRYHTYRELCEYIKEKREQDELRDNVRKIARDGEIIKKQNSAIIANQNRLYAQNEKHHRESMEAAISSYRGIISKLDEVKKSVDSFHEDFMIYY